MKEHFREGEPIKCCMECLNYSSPVRVHKSQTVFKTYNRFVDIGTCMVDGLQVSQWCSCDSWQDDA